MSKINSVKSKCETDLQAAGEVARNGKRAVREELLGRIEATQEELSSFYDEAADGVTHNPKARGNMRLKCSEMLRIAQEAQEE